MTAGAGPRRPRGTARFGTFDAERFWRPASLARLPSLVGAGAHSVVAGLDETLAAACGPDDLLVTRGALAPAQLDALGEAGITFRSLAAGEATTGDAGAVVEQALADDPALCAALATTADIRPYAVLPATARLPRRHPGGAGELPPPSVVQQVNGKAWSSELAAALGLPGAGTVVRSADELTAAVERLAGPVLVKDPYGVAGRGTVELTGPGALRRLVRRLQTQEDEGLHTELVVQRRYERAHDLSAHLEVRRDGTWSLRGLQGMTNGGYRHAVSHPVPPELPAELDRRGYPAVLERVAGALAAAGYFGPAGIDSMLLADGGWLPVLEINARMSMGLLTLELDERVRPHGLRAHLWQQDMFVEPGADVTSLLSALRTAGLLYGGGARPGVLPLSGGTLRTPRGRLVCAALCAPGDFPALRARTEGCAATAGISTTRAEVPAG
ncbi:peptide ligase PGM1-related protein [Streptomyces sp. NPDC002431]